MPTLPSSLASPVAASRAPEYVTLDSQTDGRVHVVRKESDGTYSVPVATYRSRREARAGIRGQKLADAFNAANSIGRPVEYWTMARGAAGTGKMSITRSEATVLPSGTAVVWVVGQAGCIALSHVEPVRASL